MRGKILRKERKAVKQGTLIIPPNTRGTGKYEYICTACFRRYPDYRAAGEADRWGCKCGRKGTIEKMRACLLQKRKAGQLYLG